MKFLQRYLLALTFLVLPFVNRAASILIPMDEEQKDHLKSYGIAFWTLFQSGTFESGVPVKA